MAEPLSDAFVLFGATGDLAFKKIFPALHWMLKRGRAFPDRRRVARWLQSRQFAERARASIQEFGGGGRRKGVRHSGAEPALRRRRLHERRAVQEDQANGQRRERQEPGLLLVDSAQRFFERGRDDGHQRLLGGRARGGRKAVRARFGFCAGASTARCTRCSTSRKSSASIISWG